MELSNNNFPSVLVHQQNIWVASFVWVLTTELSSICSKLYAISFRSTHNSLSDMLNISNVWVLPKNTELQTASCKRVFGFPLNHPRNRGFVGTPPHCPPQVSARVSRVDFGHMWVCSTRKAKRTPKSMVQEGGSLVGDKPNETTAPPCPAGGLSFEGASPLQTQIQLPLAMRYP